MEESKAILPLILDGEDKSSSLKNRIRKNYKHIRKFAKRTDTDCFRIYDAEIPYFPIAIDIYAGRFCVHYFSKRGEEEVPERLYQEVNEALQSLFGITEASIFWRTRIKREKTEQYEKVSDSKEFFKVREYGASFWINLENYLDTGLFLDHREMRHFVASFCKGKKVLNLFAYTASFTVHAALMGSTFTKTVDMSNTYCKWAEENLLLNNLSLKNNEIVRADCLKFIEEEMASRAKYDIIIIDPPTLSRSKKMDQMFDIQIDYVSLIKNGLKLLSKEGILFFSTNSRRFHFDEFLFEGCKIEEISKKTVPLDFQDPKIHRSWKIMV